MFELLTNKPCDYWAAAFILFALLFFLPNRMFDTSTHRKAALVSFGLICCWIGMQQQSGVALTLLLAAGLILAANLLFRLNANAGASGYGEDKL